MVASPRGPLVEIPYTVETRADTGLYNARLGMWLFIASEIMLFGGLFSSYLLLRISAGDAWPVASEFLHPGLAALNSFLLIASSVTFVLAWRSLAEDGSSSSQDAVRRFRLFLWVTTFLGVAFLAIKGYEYRLEWNHGYRPSTNNFFGMYWVLTGLHGLHLVGGVLLNLFLLGPGAAMRRDQPVRYLHRVEVAGLYWHFVDLVWIVLFPTLYLF